MPKWLKAYLGIILLTGLSFWVNGKINSPFNISSTRRLLTHNICKEELKELGAIDYSLGYDAIGNITLWVNNSGGLTLGECDKYNVPHPWDAYYQAFVGKYFLDKIPTINKIWLYEDSEINSTCISVSRSTYNKSPQSKLPFQKDAFFRSQNITEMMDDCWYSAKDGEFPKSDFSDYVFVTDSFKRLFGKRIKRMELADLSADSAFIELTIKGLPGNGEIQKLNDEIAKAFTLSVGRFYNHYWNPLAHCTLVYTNEKGQQLLKVWMTIKDFERWLKDGLDKESWPQYCSELKIKDPKIQFSRGKAPMKKRSVMIEDADYQSGMSFLQSNPDVEVLFLGVNQQGLDAVLRMKDLPDNEIYRKQMIISQKLMDMPFHSIWFIWEKNKQIKMLQLDRARYNVLMFMNSDKRYDFPVKDWPLMAANYWEVTKRVK